MTPNEEEQLQEELTSAHHNFEKGLYTHAFFKVHDPVMGQDLVQETFLKTWKYLVKGGRVETMKAFLYHVLDNLIIDEYRKHHASSLDDMLENGFEPPSEESENFLDVSDGKSAINLIKELPEKYQKVMYLRYVKLLSLPEIAQVIGQSKNTITVQTHRGLEKLKELYNSKLKHCDKQQEGSKKTRV